MSKVMTIPSSAIEIDSVSQRFGVASGVVHALDGIRLAIGDGEFVSIVGPSGCGKSTIMRIVAGLIEPSAGSVRVFGETVTGPAANVGIVFQKATLLPWRNTVDNILLQIEMRDLPRSRYEARLSELVALTGLSGFELALPHELSGGMQ
ncbi:MAG: ABC transporter ATP-binding protein, partial [Rhodospirillales bacterium]